jgi:hypothetical protein
VQAQQERRGVVVKGSEPLHCPGVWVEIAAG